MYCSMRKITNVRGRADYITNEKRQENIIAVASTVDNQEEFARTLARESQQRFAEYNSNKNAKCIEAREFIIGLPNNLTNNEYKLISQTFVNDFKNKYGVDCIGAIHSKNSKGQNNIHLHLLFSERPTLKVPQKQSEIRAKRNFYYDKDWKRCKKSEAVHIKKKGELLQKGYTRYFSDKIAKFKSKDFIDEYQEYLSEKLSMPKFDKNRHYATKHIGKHNPKKKYIEEYNSFVNEMNMCFDKLEENYPYLFEGSTPKKDFNKMLQKQKIEKLSTDKLKNALDSFIGKIFDIVQGKGIQQNTSEEEEEL